MNHKNFREHIENGFGNKRIMIIGDLMVDEYITGKVSRISPEAPVPILNYRESRREAGGASNVAHNIKALGASTLMVGVIGEDDAGIWLEEHLSQSGIETEGIVRQTDKPTSIKTRFATKGQQLFRMDNEDVECIAKETQEKIIAYLQKELDQCQAVILSDYKKGVLNQESFVKRIILLCNQHHVLVAIDSKSRKIEAFENADFVKPNNLELEEAVNIRITDEASLDRAGRHYLEKSKAKALVVTRGAAGISVFLPEQKRCDYEAQAAQVFDVTGAGDTVISVITLGMVCGLPIGEAVRLANLAASVVVSKVGTYAITGKDLLKRIDA